MNIITAQRIRELIKEYGKSQRKLAESIGVSQSTINAWISDKNEPSIFNLWLLADYFDVTIDYLVGRSEF